MLSASYPYCVSEADSLKQSCPSGLGLAWSLRQGVWGVLGRQQAPLGTPTPGALLTASAEVRGLRFQEARRSVNLWTALGLQPGLSTWGADLG